MKGVSRRPSAMAFSPDLRLFATDFYQDVDLRDTATGKIRRTFADHAGPVGGLAFSSDGKRLAVNVSAITAGDPPVYYSQLALWDVATGKRLATVAGLDQCLVHGFVADNDHLILLTAKDYDSRERKVRVLDVTTGKVRTALTFESGERLPQLVVSGDGRTVAIPRRDGRIAVYDVK